MIPAFVLLGNGSLPTSDSYKITPQLQRSVFSLKSPLRSSGEAY